MRSPRKVLENHLQMDHEIVEKGGDENQNLHAATLDLPNLARVDFENHAKDKIDKEHLAQKEQETAS